MASMEAIKSAVDLFKHLTTLNAGSIVVIGTFLKDIFPHKDGTLAVGLGIKLWIAAAFILFGLSLVFATYFMTLFSTTLERWARSLDTEPPLLPRSISLVARVAPFYCYVFGLVCFGAAVLINLF